jgi:hypothetical protein
MTHPTPKGRVSRAILCAAVNQKPTADEASGHWAFFHRCLGPGFLPTQLNDGCPPSESLTRPEALTGSLAAQLLHRSSSVPNPEPNQGQSHPSWHTHLALAGQIASPAQPPPQFHRARLSSLPVHPFCAVHNLSQGQCSWKVPEPDVQGCLCPTKPRSLTPEESMKDQ